MNKTLGKYFKVNIRSNLSFGNIFIVPFVIFIYGRTRKRSRLSAHFRKGVFHCSNVCDMTITFTEIKVLIITLKIYNNKNSTVNYLHVFSKIQRLWLLYPFMTRKPNSLWSKGRLPRIWLHAPKWWRISLIFWRRAKIKSALQIGFLRRRCQV